jgi:cysteinyl-tRNA synthetase
LVSPAGINGYSGWCPDARKTMTATTTGLRLYNTKARAKQDFTPIDASNVRMYVCGPTVYDRAHLGNARPVIVFDTLFRLLRHMYGADHVTYVRNFTDVDDKINAEALRRQRAGAAGTLEDLIRERTEETIAWYHADMDALGALRPTMEPRATEFIGQMVAMIEGLVASDHAYAAEGHVLFAVDSYKDYGKLSGRTVDDMIAGARVEVAPYKRNPMDFVLWKPSSGEEPGWASPWGKGRPGWHIECSAMAHELLGETCNSPTTKTRSPNPPAPTRTATSRITGCTTKCCRSRARRCPRVWGTSSRCGTCWIRACRAR